jgi:hypothetical protein
MAGTLLKAGEVLGFKIRSSYKTVVLYIKQEYDFCQRKSWYEAGNSSGCGRLAIPLRPEVFVSK